MSRIGKKLLPVPKGVKVQLAGRLLTVEGPKGKLEWEHRPEVAVAYDEPSHTITVVRHNEEALSRALHGTTRALVQNMLVGVSQGYERRLEIIGVGYLAAVIGQVLQLRVGFANELQVPIPEGIKVSVPDHAAYRRSGNRQANGRPFRRQRPRFAEARALQRQGDSFPGRSGPPQTGQGHGQVIGTRD